MQKNKVVISVIALAVLGVGYWLFSPFWRNPKLNEALPVATTTNAEDKIQDKFLTMDSQTKASFEAQTQNKQAEIIKTAEEMPNNSAPISTRARLVARAHEVSGEVLLVNTGNEKFIRFENLKTINGPDLRIYLSAGLNAEDFVDLGPIRATEGNVNYVLPKSTDTAKYKNVLIWCRAFNVLFSYAQL